MAYRLPTFNLTAKIWTGPQGVLPPAGAPRLTAACALWIYKTGMLLSPLQTAGTIVVVCIKWPAGTDVRPLYGFNGGLVMSGDVVELPALSGRFYEIISVDDVARGYANQYRISFAKQRQSPIPIT